MKNPSRISLLAGLGLLVLALPYPVNAGIHAPYFAGIAQTEPQTMDHSGLEDAGAQLQGAVHLEGVLNALSADTVNVTHKANPAIGWPAMTMDLPLAPYARITPDLEAGTPVRLMLTLGNLGSYRVAAIEGSPRSAPKAGANTAPAPDGIPAF